MSKITKKVVYDRLCTYKNGKIDSYKNNEKDSSLISDKYTNWRRTPVDLVWDNPLTWDNIFGDGNKYSLLNDFLTYSINHNNHKVIRYPYLEHIFNILEDMIHKSAYYTVCKIGNSFKWVEVEIDTEDIYAFFYDNQFGFMTELPDINDVKHITINEFNDIDTTTLKNGDSYIVVNKNDELYPNVGFKTWAGTETVTARSVSGWSDVVCVNKLGDEYVDSFIKNGKRYDKLLFRYAENIFNRENIDYGTRIDTPYIDCYFTINNDISNLGVYTPYIEQWIGGKKYYLGDKVVYDNRLYELRHLDEGQDYYRGKYDQVTGYILFDDVNNPHWEEDMEAMGETDTITGTTTSYISEMRRFLVDYDDDNNPLPFNIHKANDGTIDSDDCEIQYLLGKNKTNKSEYKEYADIVVAVSFLDKDCNVVEYFRYDASSNDDVLKGFKGVGVKSIPDNAVYIKFLYTKGAIVEADEEKSIREGSGITFSEVYACKKDTLKANYNGKKDIIFTYLSVDYDKTYKYNSDDNKMEEMEFVRSEYSYTKGEEYVETFMNADIFFNEAMLGIIDSQNSINVDIERNGADTSSYESHSILSEVNTFEDLQNYRNNFFNID